MAKISLEFESKILGKPTEIFVYIPKSVLIFNEDKTGNKNTEKTKEINEMETLEEESTITNKNETSKTNPPVVLLLHGKSGTGSSFYDHTDVIAFSEKYGVITIAPSVENSYYTNMAWGERYFDYLSKEVPFMVNQTLNITMDKVNSYVLGYSMGGYGAMKLGLTYPERFRGMASLSGSLRSVSENRELMKSSKRYDLELCYGVKNLGEDAHNDLYSLIDRIIEEGKEIPELYLYCGEEDRLMDYNLRFKEYLEKMNIPHIFVKDEGSHEFKYWNKQMEYYFRKIKDNEV